ncbi:MAG: hypothetical protein V7607_5430 [Solirubrobacteraceae bacterium]
MNVDALAPVLDEFVPIVLKATHTPGVTLAVMDLKGNQLAAGYGLSNLAARTPMDAGAVMKGASMSKLIGGIAALQLVEHRVLDLHKPITDYLDLDVRNPCGPRAISAFDLLTHQSGLATDCAVGSLRPPPPLAEHLESSYREPHRSAYGGVPARWTAPVGTRYQYSNLGLATVGHLVAELNGEHDSYADYVEHTIFAPLGMTSTSVPPVQNSQYVSPKILARLVTGYARYGGWWVPYPAVHVAGYPASNILTTALDYTRLLLALLNGGRHDGKAILSSRAVRHLLTPHASGVSPGEPPGLWTGLSVEMRNLRRRDFWFGHGGAYRYGWWGESRAYPHLGFAITIVANAWDAVREFNPPRRIAPGIIADFVARWTMGGDARRPATVNAVSWSDGAAYAMGVLFAERLRGVLGVQEDLTAIDTAAMLAGARCLEDELPTRALSREHFDAGVSAINAIATPTPQEIRAVLAHPEAHVPPAVLDLYALAFGASRAEYPVPMRFWADRVEESGQTEHLTAIPDHDPRGPL